MGPELKLAGLLGLALAACFATARILPAWERWARRTGHLDRPAGRKDHLQATPLVGGLAILSVVVLGLGGALALSWILPIIAVADPLALGHELSLVRARSAELLALLGGAVVLALVGAIDDRRGLGAWPRLAIQALAALGLVAADLKVTLFFTSPLVQGALTVLFVVFLTNAMNFIDNMNGAMGGAAYLGAAQLAAIALGTDQLFLAAAGAVLAGALRTHLSANFPQARVFMGDAGSTAIGFLLAGLTIACDFHQGPFAWDPITLPLCALAWPFVDGVLVCGTRLARGVHPFTPGHDHLAHRLVRAGLSRPRAVLALWALAAVPAQWVLWYADGDIWLRAAVIGIALAALLPLVRRGWSANALGHAPSGGVSP